MSISGLSIDGLASGLDTKSIIQQLMALETKPLETLTTRQSQLESAQGVWKDINTRMAGLQSKAEQLKLDKAFQSVKAVSSDASAMTVTGNSSSVTGAYQVSIQQLAKVQTDLSGVFTSATNKAEISGTLTINGQAITVNSSDTLTTIKDNINAKTKDTSVSASIVQTKPGEYQLVLTGLKTGSTNTIAWSGSSSALSFTRQQSAQRAIVEVNGLKVENDSNTIQDAIPGVTMNLLRGPATPSGTDPVEPLEVGVTVSRDIDSIIASVKGFVDQYNSLATFISDKQTYDKDKKIAGALLGDATASGIVRDLRQDLTDRVAGITAGKIAGLADIGVKTGAWGSADYGKLTVDEGKLREKLQSNPDDVAALFTSENGIASKIADYTKGYTDSVKGILPRKDKDLTDQIKSVKDQLEVMTDRLAERQKIYEAQFAALETALGKLKNQQSWLTSQLSQLGAQ